MTGTVAVKPIIRSDGYVITLVNRKEMLVALQPQIIALLTAVKAWEDAQ